MSNAEIVQSSSQLLEQVKARVEHIESLVVPAVFRSFLPVADVLAQAKEAYEQETGTGHGRRNPTGLPAFRSAAAEAIGRSESFVERLLQLSKLDPKTRELAAVIPKLIGNQDALVALAREPSPERRHLAIAAFSAGGRAGFDHALDRLIDPVDLEAVDEAAVSGFLTSYAEAKAAAADARKGEHATAEPKALARRRKNAQIVFDYLKGGEHKIDDGARERMGLSRSACKKALEDLCSSDIIQSSGYLGDHFEVFDDRDISQLVIEQRKARCIVSVSSGAPTRQKLPAGTYEIMAINDGQSIRITLRAL